MQQRWFYLMGWILSMLLVVWEVRAFRMRNSRETHVVTVVPPARTTQALPVVMPSPQPAQPVVNTARGRNTERERREPDRNYQVDVSVRMDGATAPIVEHSFSTVPFSMAEHRWQSTRREGERYRLSAENSIRLTVRPSEMAQRVLVEMEYVDGNELGQRVTFRSTFLMRLGEPLRETGQWSIGPARVLQLTVR